MVDGSAVDGSAVEHGTLSAVWTAAVAAFLGRPLHAVLATRAPDGSISQSVVWFRAEIDSVWISCRPDSAKACHVRLDPEVSLLVLAPHGGSYVRVEGKATVDEVLSDEQRLTLVGPYQGAEVLVWLAEHPLPSPNALLRIRPDRVVSRGV
ncbi:MAG: pyridoxamine 5'-phosphate oxidase family protein [Actinomycetota bacterium]|nr:pyridoxamine 5'-phosphate oxidase family protein [Actinomycetota bacterium]